jgi:hypothetical protein
VLVVVISTVLVFAVVTVRLFVWPAQGMPARVSAIVMLAGPGDRPPVALRLAEEHRAKVLVISRDWSGHSGSCAPPMAGVKLICFYPDPENTRGEAEFTGRLAKKYHWTSVVLVTSTAQDTRARVLVGRCFNGSVYVVTVPLAAADWPYQIAYQWGALIKALIVHRGC